MCFLLKDASSSLFLYITAPIINTTTVEVITSVNQPTTLFIETTGNPPAEIEWSKDGSPVNHPIMSDGSLYIMHTEPSDQGEYTVTATNPVGVSQQSITVTVIQPVALHCKNIFLLIHSYEYVTEPTSPYTRDGANSIRVKYMQIQVVEVEI